MRRKLDLVRPYVHAVWFVFVYLFLCAPAFVLIPVGLLYLVAPPAPMSWGNVLELMVYAPALVAFGWTLEIIWHVFYPIGLASLLMAGCCVALSAAGLTSRIWLRAGFAVCGLLALFALPPTSLWVMRVGSLLVPAAPALSLDGALPPAPASFPPGFPPTFPVALLVFGFCPGLLCYVTPAFLLRPIFGIWDQASR